MNKYKVIIAGSRDFKDFSLLELCCNSILSEKVKEGIIEIVSGGAKGADSLGELYAYKCRHHTMLFEVDWDQHGKKAGILRYIEMGDYADALIALRMGS